MKNGVEKRKNGIIIEKVPNGMYFVKGGRKYAYYSELKKAREYADSLSTTGTNRD